MELYHQNEAQRVMIRTLNDAFRQFGFYCSNPPQSHPQIPGTWVLTDGVYHLCSDYESLLELDERIGTYDRFSPENDPYGEHDFGSLEFQGHTLFWKFDYYASNPFEGQVLGSEEPWNPNCTFRVLTVLRAEEY